MSDETPEPRDEIQAAQERLQARYAEWKAAGRGWRALAAEVGANLRWVYGFATRGELPADPVIRELLLTWQPERKEMPMNAQMQRLKNVLEFFHVGKAHAISRRELLEYLFGAEAAEDESNNNPFDRQMRLMIQELNSEHGAVVCPSTKGGYFWAETLDEVLEAIGPLERGARTQLINAGHLKANARRLFGGQMRLGL